MELKWTKLLKKIGFSEIEAKIYECLVYKPGLNPTQLSKILEISRVENTYILGEAIEEYKNYIDNIEKIYSEDDMTLVNEKEVLIITGDIAYYTQNKYIVKNIYKRIELEKRVK